MEERKKRRGDRRDAYWVRDLDGLHTIMPHLMDKRTDAEVYVNMPFDVTETLRPPYPRWFCRKSECLQGAPHRLS